MNNENFQKRRKEILDRYEHLLGTDEWPLALMNDEDYQKLAEEEVLAFNPYNYTDDTVNDALGKPRRGETMEDFKKRTQQ